MHARGDLGGIDFRLADLRGKAVWVNFWTTWCVPCREEMPEFVRAQQEFGGKGLQFVGIAVDQVDKVRDYVKEIHINYPVLIGGFGAIELSKTLEREALSHGATAIVAAVASTPITSPSTSHSERRGRGRRFIGSLLR